MKYPSHFLFSLTTAALFAVLSGCERYSPQPLDSNTIDNSLKVPGDHDLQARVAGLRNPQLRPPQRLEFHPELGLSPDEAAVLAVLLNPSLRAQRDAHGIAQAALLQAGILPNPQLTYSYDWNTGGTTLGNLNAYGIGLNYDVTALISHAAKANAAGYNAESVDLTIAWQEWQIAQAAKMAVYDLLSLQSQLALADEVDRRLGENLNVVQKAADLRLKNAVDLAAAQSASHDAHAIVLQARHDVEHQRQMLNRAMGLPPQIQVVLRKGLALASEFDPPEPAQLFSHLESARLDLVGLRQGYQSQEQTVVAACLDQIPRISLGLNRARDNTNVRSIGIGLNIDLPLFDRNQGVIATEKANRQKLFDEYLSRVYEARADIAVAIADIHALNAQIKDVREALPSLQKLVEVYKQAVDHGNADVLSYYVAWNNLTQKNLDLLKLQQQLADSRVALEIAAGQYFSDPTNLPTTAPTTAPALPATQSAGENASQNSRQSVRQDAGKTQ